MISENEIIRYIEKIEVENNLFENKIKNVYFWKLFRYPFYLILNKMLNESGEVQPNKLGGKKKILLDKSKELKYKLLKDATNIKRNYDTIILESSAYVSFEGKRIDRLTEFITDAYAQENLGEVIRLEPFYGIDDDNKYALIPLPFTPFILRRIYYFLSLFKKHEVLVEINKSLRSEWDLEIDISKSVWDAIADFKIRKAYYIKIFKRIKPKRIFVVCAYGLHDLVAAASELNIKVIEIQHGMIERQHLGYSFHGQTSVPYFPNKLLLFGEYWRNSAEFPLKEENLVVSGYPYMNKKLEKVARIKRESGAILFISTGSVGGQLIDYAIEVAENMPQRRIYYKLHPGEFGVAKKIYPQLLQVESKSNFYLIENQYDLYELMQKCEFLVPARSTSIYEAFIFNMKIIIPDLLGKEWLENIIALFNLPVVKNINELLFLLKKYELNIDKEQGEYFFYGAKF